MGQRIPLGKVTDVPAGEAVVVEVNKKDVAVFHHAGRFYAIDDLCPHMGASLAGGYVEKGIVSCPWHAWRFCIHDGKWCDNPRIKIDAFETRVQGDDVQVRVVPKALPPGAAT